MTKFLILSKKKKKDFDIWPHSITLFSNWTSIISKNLKGLNLFNTIENVSGIAMMQLS